MKYIAAILALTLLISAASCEIRKTEIDTGDSDSSVETSTSESTDATPPALSDTTEIKTSTDTNNPDVTVAPLFPTLEIYNLIHEKEPELKPYLSLDINSSETDSDNRLHVNFTLNVGAAFYPQAIHGSYTFDSETGEISNLVYDPIQTETAGNDLSDDEIKKIVDENLDVLITDSDRIYSEKDFIDAHPEAFEKIVSLGEAAISPLEEIIASESTHYNNADPGKIPKGLAAMIAAYAVKPSLFDLTFYSPDEKYMLCLCVGTFLQIEFGGTITTAYDHINIISVEKGQLTFSLDTEARYYGAYTHVEVSWSPDGAYAAIRSIDEKWYSITDICDVRNSEMIALPSLQEEILPAAMPEDEAPSSALDFVEYSVVEWLKNDAVKIGYRYREGNFSGGQGDYVFDLNSGIFSQVSFSDTDETISAETSTEESADTTPPDSSDTTETETETKPQTEPEPASEDTTVQENVYYTTDLDSSDFAWKLRNTYYETKQSTVMYYDNGTNRVKFEIAPDGDDSVFKINDNVVDFSITHDNGQEFTEIFIADEFIAALSMVLGSDSGEVIYIFDYDGNILFQTYYLSNTGIAAYNIKSVDNNKIIIWGTRIAATSDINLSFNKNSDRAWTMFSDYHEYLCDCPEYDYEIPYIWYDKSSLDQFMTLDKDDIINADFEIDYLGGGKFSKLKIVPSSAETIGDIIEKLKNWT